MKYRNVSGLPQSLIGYGVAEPNEIITTSEAINNPNFEPVVEKPTEKVESKKEGKK